MDNKTSYVLPSDTEKLSHKFLLDGIRVRKIADAASVTAETVAAEVAAPVVAPPAMIMSTDSFQAPALPRGKKYFRIGEVAEIIGVEAHVLRYWETEFTMIRPSKSGGQRVYRKKDVETLHLIRHLLHVEKFSIRGARKKVLEYRRSRATTLVTSAAAAPPAAENAAPAAKVELLQEIAHELKELVKLAMAL